MQLMPKPHDQSRPQSQPPLPVPFLQPGKGQAQHAGSRKCLGVPSLHHGKGLCSTLEVNDFGVLWITLAIIMLAWCAAPSICTIFELTHTIPTDQIEEGQVA